MTEAGPQLNGPASPSGKYIETIDPEDPQYIKNLQRPAEVKEDLQQMENRSRVSLVLNSQAFKDELEQVVEEQLRSGPYPASLIALQQITDLLLPHSKGSIGSLARASTVIPINDLRGVESLGFAKGEKLLRCKVAALYRLVDLCGWSHGIYNHISARVNSTDEHFLLNPFGLMYSEVTASSLIKVDVSGQCVEPGSTLFGISKAGFTLHAAIHQARPDIKCIVHLHTPAAVAVSAMKFGLLPLCQEALICGNVSYHEYSGIFIDPEEKEKLARNLGVHNKILFLRNHGVAVCGETVEEAFHFVFNLMAACESQVKAVPAGVDNLILPTDEAREQAFKVANQGGGGVETAGRKWKIGEMEFEALMRTLDNSGYRTGHVYKQPLLKQEKKDRSNSEVEIPPASSSFTYVFDGDYEHSKYASPLRAAMERQKKAYKAGWLTTPNTYKKTEVEEIGTTTPKKITKWVPEGESPNRPGAVVSKVEHPNQFAPQGANPKEFKQKQKSIKKDYYEEKVNAGPQSKLLEGMTWDEAQKAKDGQLSGAGDQLIVVGAASKGIILRDHQHNAVVYRQYYAANPFENMTESEMEQYQSEVQRREAGESIEETPEAASDVPIPQPQLQPQPQPPVQDQPNAEVGQRFRQPEDSNGYVDTSKISQSPQGPFSPRAEDSMSRLADKVVQTVIRDALAVVRQGKGQQTLTRAHSSNQNLFPFTQDMGSQMNPDTGDFLLRQAVFKAQCALESEIYGSSNCGRDNAEERKTDGNGNSITERAGSLHESRFRSRPDLESNPRVNTGVCPEGAAGVATEYAGWNEVGASDPDDDSIKVQLNPIQLYHGQAEGGVMKVKFSIQSTVRRRVRAEISKGGSIEEIYAAVTEPVIEHYQTGSSSFEQSEFVLQQDSFLEPVKVKKKKKQKTSAKDKTEQRIYTPINIEHTENEAPVQKKKTPVPVGNQSKLPDKKSKVEESKCTERGGHMNNMPDTSTSTKRTDVDMAVGVTIPKTIDGTSNKSGKIKAGVIKDSSVHSVHMSEDEQRLECSENKIENVVEKGDRDKCGVQEDKDGREVQLADEKDIDILSTGQEDNDVECSVNEREDDIKFADDEDFEYRMEDKEFELEKSAQNKMEKYQSKSFGDVEDNDVKYPFENLRCANERDDDIKFADDMVVREPGFKESAQIKMEKNQSKSERKSLPPPPLPPVHEPKYTKSKKGSRHKMKQSRPPLSPVKEEFGGTTQEIEEMEAILEEVDDSFEQLLITAEDDVLITSMSDHSDQRDNLDLKDFVGVAPIAAEDAFDADEMLSRKFKGVLVSPPKQNICAETLSEPEATREEQTEVDNHEDIYLSSPTAGEEDDEYICLDSKKLAESFGSESSGSESGSESNGDDIAQVNVAGSQKFSLVSPEISMSSPVEPCSQRDERLLPTINPMTPDRNDKGGDEMMVLENQPGDGVIRWKMETNVDEIIPNVQTAVIDSTSLVIADDADRNEENESSMNNLATEMADMPSEKGSQTASTRENGTRTFFENASASRMQRDMDVDINKMENVRTCEKDLGLTEINRKAQPEKLSKKPESGLPQKKLTNVDDIPGTLMRTWDNSSMKMPKKETNIDDVVLIAETEKGTVDITSSQRREIIVDNITPPQKKAADNGVTKMLQEETYIDDMSQNREMAYDDISAPQKRETDIDVLPTLQMKAADVDITGMQKKETNIDDVFVSSKKATNIDDIESLHKRETNIDDIAPSHKSETNVDDIAVPHKSETKCVDDIAVPHKRETNVDDIAVPHKSETKCVDDIAVPHKRETNVDDIAVPHNRETNVDDIAVPHERETNVDDIAVPHKRETNVDDVAVPHKREINVDDIAVPHKRETNVDDVAVLHKRETNVDEFALSHYRETNVDNNTTQQSKETVFDVAALSKKKTDLSSTFVPQKKETNADDMVRVRQNNVDLKKTDVGIENSKRQTKDIGIGDDIQRRTESTCDDMRKQTDVIEPDKTSMHTSDLKTKNKVHLAADEGPIGTSSPKIGRSKSKDSSFKTYPQKLGKSEETLLDIMPLGQQTFKPAAKSQEELEDPDGVEPPISPLSRTASLGPHHRNRKKKSSRVPELASHSCKETLLIEDHPSTTTGLGKENIWTRNLVLDQQRLMKHNEMMELSSARSVFKAPAVVTHSAISEGMPPLPETTEVPSISDTESRQKFEEKSRNVSKMMKSKQTWEPSMDVVMGREEDSPKRKWVPKQRKDKHKQKYSVREGKEDLQGTEQFLSNSRSSETSARNAEENIKRDLDSDKTPIGQQTEVKNSCNIDVLIPDEVQSKLGHEMHHSEAEHEYREGKGETVNVSIRSGAFIEGKRSQSDHGEQLEIDTEEDISYEQSNWEVMADKESHTRTVDNFGCKDNTEDQRIHISAEERERTEIQEYRYPEDKGELREEEVAKIGNKHSDSVTQEEQRLLEECNANDSIHERYGDETTGWKSKQKRKDQRGDGDSDSGSDRRDDIHIKQGRESDELTDKLLIAKEGRNDDEKQYEQDKWDRGRDDERNRERRDSRDRGDQADRDRGDILHGNNEDERNRDGRQDRNDREWEKDGDVGVLERKSGSKDMHYRSEKDGEKGSDRDKQEREECTDGNERDRRQRDASERKGRQDGDEGDRDRTGRNNDDDRDREKRRDRDKGRDSDDDKDRERKRDHRGRDDNDKGRERKGDGRGKRDGKDREKRSDSKDRDNENERDGERKRYERDRGYDSERDRERRRDSRGKEDERDKERRRDSRGKEDERDWERRRDSRDKEDERDKERRRDSRGKEDERDRERRRDSRGKEDERDKERRRDSRGKDDEIDRERRRDSRGKEDERDRERRRDSRGKEDEGDRERRRDSRGKEDERDWERRRDSRGKEDERDKERRRDSRGKEDERDRERRRDSRGKEDDRDRERRHGRDSENEKTREMRDRKSAHRMKGNADRDEEKDMNQRRGDKDGKEEVLAKETTKNNMKGKKEDTARRDLHDYEQDKVPVRGEDARGERKAKWQPKDRSKASRRSGNSHGSIGHDDLKAQDIPIVKRSPATGVEMVELSSLDMDVSNSRMIPDVQSSPRLSRRRGGAIAPGSNDEKKVAERYGLRGKEKKHEQMEVPKKNDGLLKTRMLGDELNEHLRKSNLSLASSAHSRRSTSSLQNRVFENSPELIPPKPQIDPLTGEPFFFIHPLMSKSMESLRSCDRGSYARSHHGMDIISDSRLGLGERSEEDPKKEEFPKIPDKERENSRESDNGHKIGKEKQRDDAMGNTKHGEIYESKKKERESEQNIFEHVDVKKMEEIDSGINKKERDFNSNETDYRIRHSDWKGRSADERKSKDFYKTQSDHHRDVNNMIQELREKTSINTEGGTSAECERAIHEGQELGARKGTENATRAGLRKQRRRGRQEVRTDIGHGERRSDPKRYEMDFTDDDRDKGHRHGSESREEERRKRESSDANTLEKGKKALLSKGENEMHREPEGRKYRRDEELEQFDFLLTDNPIEMGGNIMNDEEKEKEPPPLPPKKGLLSRLSCVGGKSYNVSKKHNSQNKRPLEKTPKLKEKKSTEYYEEGEKRTIKKLSKDKDSGQKDHYFQELDDDPYNGQSDVSDGEPPKEPEPTFTRVAAVRGRKGNRYEKKHEAFNEPKPLSSFTEPVQIPNIDALADLDYSKAADDVLARIAEEESLSSYRSSSRDANKSSNLKSFGKKDSTSTSNENGMMNSFANTPTDSTDKVVHRDEFEQPKGRDEEGETKFSDEKESHVLKEELMKRQWEPRERRDKRPSSSTEKPYMKNNEKDRVRSKDVNKELPKKSPRHKEHQAKEEEDSEDILPVTHSPDLDSSLEQSHLNMSAPAHFNQGQKNVFGPASEHGNLNDSQPFTDTSFDPSASFDTSETHYRKKRAISFDYGRAPTSNPTFNRSQDDSPVQRRISQTSLGMESSPSRTRSSSTTSNPLSYQPWRAKVRRRSRSMSISEMVLSGSGTRPRKSHSIGEIYNSTVASSVARRRSRTPSSGDILSRMYQPRQRSRSRASLGDTSFGSAAPAQHRRISRESLSADANVHSTHAVAEPSNAAVAVKRSESERQPNKNPKLVEELDRKNVERSKSDRRPQLREELGDDKPGSPSKSDTMRSTDSASGGETLEERSSKEGSPTKEHPSPTKEKKKKKKFRIPSFSKKKNKESKESAI